MPIGTVLCLGGALTRGDDGNIGAWRTFRGTVQTLLAAQQYTLDFVGPELLAPASGGNDADHAGYTDASIDATGSAGNNLTSRLAALKTAHPSVNLVIIDAPWWDIVNAPTSLASRYSTFVAAVQSGAWASTKVVLCTAHPAAGKTQMETAALYAAFDPLNAQIRSMASASRIVADAAALSGLSRAALAEQLIASAQRPRSIATRMGGGGFPNYWAGHRITSFASVKGYNDNWSTTPPAAYQTAGAAPSEPQSSGPGNPRFQNSVAALISWFWVYLLPGHTATNWCLEVRNLAIQGLHRSLGWKFFFQGARLGVTDGGWAKRTDGGDPEAFARWRPDGVTSIIRPAGTTGIEAWPDDTVPSRGITPFTGNFDRDLFANAESFAGLCQVRIAPLDPNGPNDLAGVSVGIAMGFDAASSLGGAHYDWIGWPFNVMDGGSDTWFEFRSREWETVSFLSLGAGAGFAAGEGHASDPGLPPPLSNYASSTQYNDAPTYSRTASQIRANPPLVPDFWEGQGGVGSGYTAVDYYAPAGGTALFLLTQSGADKVAGVISRAIIASGALASFVTGSIVSQPMPGLATRPNVFLRTSGGQVAVEPTNWDVSTAPVWLTESLSTATVGIAYAHSLAATGSPTPTFAKTAGPAWLTVDSVTGALGGTPNDAADTTHQVTITATNAAGSAVLTTTLRVVTGVAIVTDVLPAAIQGEAYLAGLVAAGGVPPYVWTLASGALPAGLTLTGESLSGTPTAASGTATPVLRVTDAAGATTTRALSIVSGTAADRPVIATATLPAGQVGVAYTPTPIVLTGAAPIETDIVAGGLPPGLVLDREKRNMLPNPQGDGATINGANTAPTGWYLLLTTGVTVTPVAQGTDGGSRYTDFRIQTTGAVGGQLIAFSTEQHVPTNVGSEWTSSAKIALLSGSMAPFSFFGLALREHGAGGFIAQTLSAVAPTGSLVRYSATRVFATTGVVLFAWAAIRFSTTGAADITIRVMEPQLEERRNRLANPTMAGALAGIPGTMPTGWLFDPGATGLSHQVVGAGSIGGVAYLDLRIHGTVVAAGWGAGVYLENAGVAGFTHGDVATLSFWLAMVAGSTAGLSLMPGAAINESTAAGAYVTGATGPRATPTAELARYAYTRALSGGATVAEAFPYLHIGLTAGAAVDITLRIARPMLEMRRNRLQNPAVAGAVAGTPGTLPTAWGFDASTTGLSRQVVGSGVQDGRPYLDLRIFGTAAASNYVAVYLDGGASGFVTGDAAAVSFWLSLVAGSTAGLATMPRAAMNENTAANGYVAGGSGASAAPTSIPARYTYTRTLSGGATVAKAFPYLLFDVTSGAAIDITLRIAAPQLEESATVRDWDNNTVPSAWADAVMPSWFADPRYPYIAGTPTVPGGFGFNVRAQNAFGSNARQLSIAVPAAVYASSPWSRFARAGG